MSHEYTPSTGLLRLEKARCAKVFKGGAVENRGDAPMGKGHDNDGAAFDLETCCYLKPVFAAYDHAVRQGQRTEIVLLAGVKTVKSFTLECCAADHVCNRSGDTAIFFGSGDVADTVSTTRIMDDFKNIPRFRDKLKSIADVGGNWRHQIGIGAVKFPDKTFFLLPANLNTLQQKNLGFAGMQDAFVTGATGVIEEMIARTTQYKNAIVFLESQGGEKHFDFDRRYVKTDQQELHVICPHCLKPHIFTWKSWDETWMTRAQDFVPTPPTVIPSSDHQAWIEHNRPLLAGKVAGFQRGDDNLIKRESGEYIADAIINETHFECFHCGGKWFDDGEFGKTRIHLDKTSHYISANPNASPNKIGFNFPQWINRRITRERDYGWGHIMLEKLHAHKDNDEYGNPEPLKIWWQKKAARSWDSTLMLNKSPERPGAAIYDVQEKIAGEKVRISGTDIQFKLTHMVYLAVAVGDGTPPRVLHYEWVKPPGANDLPPLIPYGEKTLEKIRGGLQTDLDKAQFCKARVRELDKHFGIVQINSCKDCAHEPELVREWAAEDAVFARKHNGVKWVNAWCCYNLLFGDERPSFRWNHPGRKDTWERFSKYTFKDYWPIIGGKRQKVSVNTRSWSNPSIKEISERWLKGENAPKLQIHEQFLRDNSDQGLWKQLTSEEKLPWKKNAAKLVYQKIRPDNHAWDAWAMIIERCDELGYLNSFGPPPEDVEQG